MRFLFESSPVYHIFQVEPSFSTDGSAALKLSADPGTPWSSTGSGVLPPYCVHVSPSRELA